MNYLKFTVDALDVGKITDIVSAECCGAVSVFVGTTRNSFEEKKVLSLEYEAYEPMALQQLELICVELRRRWPDIVNIAICHRLGLVGIREASVVIAISSPHRETSLKAIAIAIDFLKERVPIWKKEIYDGNKATWKENKESEIICKDEWKLFSESMCNVEGSLLPRRLVQISACEVEIERRIQCFVGKKRNEIDMCNIMDFTVAKRKEHTDHQTNIIQKEERNCDAESMTCARVSSIVVKQEYSKCHFKGNERFLGVLGFSNANK